MFLQKVVVVDHNRRFREFCRARLEKAGVQIYTTASGMETVKLVQEERFDLILLEMWPSDMDSLVLLKQMQEAGVILPVIIVSEQAHLPLNWVAETLRLGVVNFIQKPCTAGNLLKSVQFALTRLPATKFETTSTIST